jgi:hypothetical protein
MMSAIWREGKTTKSARRADQVPGGQKRALIPVLHQKEIRARYHFRQLAKMHWRFPEVRALVTFQSGLGTVVLALSLGRM